MQAFWLVLIGLVVGVGITAAGLFLVMPKMMLNVMPSRFGFDDTVAKLEQAITAAGWGHQRTMALHEKLAEKGQAVPFRVALVDLCKPEYAKSVLTSDRYVACLMPCTFGVYEADDGKVYVTKMNTGLMGRLFGGNIARVMGRRVWHDEKAMLADVCDQKPRCCAA